ncbi:MAG: S66 peptidase family protein [Lachnospiraceae bacterium]
MRFPEFLQENGTIGFVAPSFGCNIEPYKSAFDNAQKKFRALGHLLVLGPNCYEGSGIGISNTPKACGEELTEGYVSEDSDVLISCGGGELMCEILDHVDFEQIKKARPKWYMGYSDNTNMTFLLATMCDTASIYGPCAAAFGMEPWHASMQDAYDVLRGRKTSVEGYPFWEKESLKDEEHPLMPINATEPRVIHLFTPQKDAAGKAVLVEKNEAPEVAFEGRLVGGCVDCLVNLLGTGYDHVEAFNERYADEGIVWFLESCDLNVMAIRRAIWQMQHAGWFSKVKGFLIGRPLCHGQELMGLDQYHAVTDLLAEYQVPVLMDLDIGHIAPMMPLICGSHAKVQYKAQKLSIEMECR